MKEALITHLWETQRFDHRNLATTDGKPLRIVQKGTRNKQAGPDFLNAEVLIGRTRWHGHIELHIKASAWRAHRHHKDPAYENVILHVVWEEDRDLSSKPNSPTATLSLQSRVPHNLLARYQELTDRPVAPPCAAHLTAIPLTTWRKMVHQAFDQRLATKTEQLLELLKENKHDSEETTYQWLSYTLGAPINSQAFLALAKCLPWRVIQKNAPSLFHLEALLFGQAGFLKEEQCKQLGGYPESLLATHQYLHHKYQLKPPLTPAHWKFFRLRPASFPTIRLAQLAQLLHLHPNPFYLFLNADGPTLLQQLSFTQSTYWCAHYLFGKQSRRPIPGLGKATIYHLLINMAAPLLCAYGAQREDSYYQQRARELLQQLPKEVHYLTNKWQALGMPIQNALESQGAIELYHKFCQPKQCMKCNIGQYILERPPKQPLG